MERTVKEILTPTGGHKVIIYDYITGREFEEFENISLIESDRDKKFRESVHKALQMLVVSINGEKQDIVEKILNFKMEDYKFVRDEIMKIIGDEEDSKKKVAE